MSIHVSVGESRPEFRKCSRFHVTRNGATLGRELAGSPIESFWPRAYVAH
jgi:hypothetical protein